MHKHLKIVLGDWMFTDWHLFRRRRHVSKGNSKNVWHSWDLVI